MSYLDQQSAASHGIPLIPYSGGTSLEGHFCAPAHKSNPAEAKAIELDARGAKIPMDVLVPGWAWCLDFGEMGEIIKINGTSHPR